MLKVCSFLGTTEQGPTVFPLHGQSSSVFEKVAAPTLLPEITRFVESLRPRPDAQYHLVNAMGASEYYGSNINADAFPEASLVHCPDKWTGNPLLDRITAKDWPYGFPTFYNAHAYCHHRNKNPEAALGDVELAVWNPHMKRVELVTRLDKDKCTAHGGVGVWDKLKAGEFPDVSMGTRVPFDTCSACLDWKLYREAQASFNVSKHKYEGEAVLDFHKKLRASDGKGIRGLSITRKDYCTHMQHQANQILPDGRKIFVYNDYPRFFDISFVFIGADKTAKVMMKVADSGKSFWFLPDSEELGEAARTAPHSQEKTAVSSKIFSRILGGAAEEQQGMLGRLFRAQGVRPPQLAPGAIAAEKVVPLKQSLRALQKAEQYIPPVAPFGSTEWRAAMKDKRTGNMVTLESGLGSDQIPTINQFGPSTQMNHSAETVPGRWQTKIHRTLSQAERAVEDTPGVTDAEMAAMDRLSEMTRLKSTSGIYTAPQGTMRTANYADRAADAYGGGDATTLRFNVPASLLRPLGHGEEIRIPNKVYQQWASNPVAHNLKTNTATPLESAFKKLGWEEDALKYAFLGKSAKNKRSEIVKDVVPSQFAGKAIPLLTRGEPKLPKELLDILASRPLSQSLSTPAGLGIILRPSEFQRVILIQLGLRPLADRLEEEGVGLPQCCEQEEMSMGPEHFDHGLARMLLPHMASRSLLGPHIERRVVIIRVSPEKERTKTSSLPSELLHKMAASYNGYRAKVMNLVEGAQMFAGLTADEDLCKLATASVEEIFTPLSMAYIKTAFLDEVCQ